MPPAHAYTKRGFCLYRHRNTWRIGRPGSARVATPEERVLWEELRMLNEELEAAKVKAQVAEHRTLAHRKTVEYIRSRHRLVGLVRDLLIALLEYPPMPEADRVETALREYEDEAATVRKALGIHTGRDS